MQSSLKLTRRHVVVSGLAVVGGCFVGLNTQTLLSLAKAAGKPLLTQKSLTRLMRSRAKSKVYAELANDRGTDLVGFLGRYFTLTDVQINAIRTIPATQVKALKRIAQQAAARKQQEAYDKANCQKLAVYLEAQSAKAPSAKAPSAKQRLNLSTSFDGKNLTVIVSSAAN